MTKAIVVRSASPRFREQVAEAGGFPVDQVRLVPPEIPIVEFLGHEGISAGVVVLAPETPEADALAAAEALMQQVPATAVILVRNSALNGSLPAAMRAGVRDVVDLSNGNGDLQDALTRAVAWVEGVTGNGASSKPEASVIQVFSSKGGSGKSFLSCNLAAAIAGVTQHDVAIVDLDLGLGDVYSYFGVEHPTGGLLTLPEAGDARVVRSAGTKVAPNVYAYGAPDDPTATITGEATAAAVKSLRTAFPYLVIDSPADYSDRVLAALDLASFVVMVASLDVVSVRHLSIAVNTLLKLGVEQERLRYVLNRADSKVGLDARDVEKVLNVKVDAMVPSSRLVPTSLNSGELVVTAQPKSDVARSVQALAQRLIESVPAERPGSASRRRLFGRK